MKIISVHKIQTTGVFKSMKEFQKYWFQCFVSALVVVLLVTAVTASALSHHVTALSHACELVLLAFRQTYTHKVCGFLFIIIITRGERYNVAGNKRGPCY